MSKLDEFWPCLRTKNQLLDFEVHTKWAQHVQGRVVRSRLSWLVVVGRYFHAFSLMVREMKGNQQESCLKKYAVIRVFSLK